jgi:DedD protein
MQRARVGERFAMAMAEPADLNVDELRRRARRRLVGAVVLALGVAVVVPMLLETEQKPLGEDVAVKIPPIDDGKFVNRLSENRAKDAKSPAKASAPKDEVKDGAPSESAAERAPKYDTRLPDAQPASSAPSAGTKSAGGATTPPGIAAAPSTNANDRTPATAPKSVDAKSSTVERAATESSKPAAPSAAPTDTKTSTTTHAPGIAGSGAAPKTSVTGSVAPTPGKSAQGVSSSASSASPPLPSASSPAPSEPRAGMAHDGFAVQLAAFADDKGANALAGRLKRAGYAAYTEPLKTSKGTLWRVRVGPYPSRDAALAARDKLKTEGQSGIVAAIK